MLIDERCMSYLRRSGRDLLPLRTGGTTVINNSSLDCLPAESPGPRRVSEPAGFTGLVKPGSDCHLFLWEVTGTSGANGPFG